MRYSSTGRAVEVMAPCAGVGQMHKPFKTKLSLDISSLNRRLFVYDHITLRAPYPPDGLPYLYLTGD